MREEDLKIVREFFDRAKENFEQDGYLAPVLFAWAPGRPPTISFIKGNLRNILPGMCDTLRLSGYDRFALIIEGWIVLGEENLKDIESGVGRMGEHPKAQTSIQIILVRPEKTFGKFAVYDETGAGWLLVKEVESPSYGRTLCSSPGSRLASAGYTYGGRRACDKALRTPHTPSSSTCRD